VAAAGGHAMLWRAEEPLRRRLPTFHPSSSALGALEERVRSQFDPFGVFATSRFAGSFDAH
ncbi:MAG: hypothetical protein RL580_1461, partial [Pseudomonadota bacterium]